MADGLGFDRLAELLASSFVVERSALPIDERSHLAATQRRVDELLAEALTGHTNEASPCLAARYTLPVDLIGAEVADRLTLPLMHRLAGDRPFRKTIYGGVFASDPRLPVERNFHWHIDGHFDGLDELGINFWIPLRSCGREAPGIAVVRADESQLADFSALPQSIDPSGGHTDVCWHLVTDEHIERHFGPVEIPDLMLGDVLVFTNRALHRTHFPANAKSGRAALIVRYVFGHAITIPTNPV